MRQRGCRLLTRRTFKIAVFLHLETGKTEKFPEKSLPMARIWGLSSLPRVALVLNAGARMAYFLEVAV
jgi:hypothetical protein